MATECSFDPAGNYALALMIVGIAFAVAWVRVTDIKARTRVRSDKKSEPTNV